MLTERMAREMKLIDLDALKAIYGMGDDCKDCKRDSAKAAGNDNSTTKGKEGDLWMILSAGQGR